jgi:hypothetical protein
MRDDGRKDENVLHPNEVGVHRNEVLVKSG